MHSLFFSERCLHCPSAAAVAHATVFGPKGLFRRKDTPALERYLCPACTALLESMDGPAELDAKRQFQRIMPGLELEHCIAAYAFTEESPIRSVVHAFKYSDRSGLAVRIGRSVAGMRPKGIDIIVPVPLHRTRLAGRGYNQAECLAHGLAADSGIPILKAVKRIRPTPTQTALSLHERIDNVRDAFGLTRHAHQLEGSHVLLVDDVMTTGSTLASIAVTLRPSRPRAISTFALALAIPQT